MGGGDGGALSPTSSASSPSCSSDPLPPEFAEYVAVSPPVSDDGDSDECCVCDDSEVEAVRYGGCGQLQERSLREAKELIRRYKPGDWIEGVGGTKAGDYILPEITTLLLVGPRGAGKSTLVNRITRVFDKDDDPLAPDRAQVSCNSKSNGTNFLREYPVPRNSSAICIYDSRSLSSDPEKNFKMLRQWITKGISHGDMVTWDTNDGTKINGIRSLGRQCNFLRCKARKVNFVIFVVNGVSVLESIDSNTKGYTDMLHETFMYPFLSFGDDKPVVVVTHGDRLSIQQRAYVQNELAELLGIPLQQIFDIPGSDDYETDLAVLDMLRYCIQHAEQNFPIKLNYLLEANGSEALKNIAERLMGLDAIIEVAIILLCTFILLLRLSGYWWTPPHHSGGLAAGDQRHHGGGGCKTGPGPGAGAMTTTTDALSMDDGLARCPLRRLLHLVPSLLPLPVPAQPDRRLRFLRGSQAGLLLQGDATRGPRTCCRTITSPSRPARLPTMTRRANKRRPTPRSAARHRRRGAWWAFTRSPPRTMTRATPAATHTAWSKRRQV